MLKFLEKLKLIFMDLISVLRLIGFLLKLLVTAVFVG